MIRKSSYINKHPKSKWTELTNKKAQNSRLDKKAKPSHMLPLRDPSQLQGQIQTQSERVEIDTPNKWYPEKSRCSYTDIR